MNQKYQVVQVSLTDFEASLNGSAMAGFKLVQFFISQTGMVTYVVESSTDLGVHDCNKTCTHI